MEAGDPRVALPFQKKRTIGPIDMKTLTNSTRITSDTVGVCDERFGVRVGFGGTVGAVGFGEQFGR